MSRISDPLWAYNKELIKSVPTPRTILYTTPRTLSPQAHMVLEYLRSGRGLSNLIALNVLGVGSLSSRVAELRKKGFDIAGDWRREPAPHHRTYTVYKLVSEPVRRRTPGVMR